MSADSSPESISLGGIGSAIGGLGKALDGIRIVGLVTDALQDGKVTSEEARQILVAIASLKPDVIPPALIDKLAGLAPLIGQAYEALKDGKVTTIEWCDLLIELGKSIKAMAEHGEVVKPVPSGGFSF